MQLGFSKDVPRPLPTSAKVALVAVAVFTVSSFLYAATPDRNDFERIGNLKLLLVFFCCFTAWCGAYLLTAEAALSTGGPAPSLENPRFLAVLGVLSVLLLISFPVGSRDVFAYAFYGKMWGRYQANPYFHAPSAFASDPWYPLLQAWWKEGAAGYGPLFILQTRVVYALTGDHIIGAVAAYKVANFGMLLFGLGLWRHYLANQSRPDEISNAHAALWGASPLVLFEGLSSAHNDLAMAVLLMAAFVFWVRGVWFFFGVFLGLSFWYKWYSAVLVPVFVFWCHRRHRSWNEIRSAVVGGVLGATLASLIVLVPFGSAVPALLGRPFSLQVGSAVFPTELPPTLWPLFWLFLESGWFDLQLGRTLFDATRYGCAGLIAGSLILWRWKTPYMPRVVAEDCFFALLILSGFIVTVLWPWHLIAACSFGLLSGRALVAWGTVMLMMAGMLSYFLTFSMAAIGLLLGALFVVFRRRVQAGNRMVPSS